MLYTRKEIINLLMLFEEDFAKDNEKSSKSHLNGKTAKQWVQDAFEEYNNMSDKELLNQHKTILDGLYEEGNEEAMAIKSRKRLVLEKDRLWIK